MLDFSQRAPDPTNWLTRQRRYPRGTIGALIGRLTGLRNSRLIRIALDKLDLTAMDNVLEVGCGTGRAIAALIERDHLGFVTGIDHSALMARLAIRRNIEAIEYGRLEVRQAAVSRLPYLDHWFARAFAIESFPHWPRPDDDVAEIRRVLKPGGRLVLVFRRDGDSRLEKRAFEAMERAGFVETAVDYHGAGRNVPISLVGIVPQEPGRDHRVI